jgi:hypothetical protein
MIRSNVRNFLVGLTIPEILEVRAGRDCPETLACIDEWLGELYAEYAGEPCMTGTMRTGVHMLGTALVLKAGTTVNLTAATNLPYVPVGWFAAPAEDRDDWHGGEDDSILLDYRDLDNLEEL